jgi:hypothetical protein
MRRLFSLFILVIPGLAHSWGPTGHSTVCEIAYTELTREARRQVDHLIDADPQYDNFAESCNWADGPPRQREPDHYMNFPRSAQAVTVAECALADTCLFTAIDEDVSVLASSLSSERRKLEALKLLGHWVGDIHQPMHTTFADDRGANSIEVLVEEGGQPDETNLHAVWDGWIIRERLGSDYRRIARDLLRGLTDEQRDAWRFDSPVEWADESFQIAISPDARYCVRRHGACWYDEDNMILDRGEATRRLALGDGYAIAHQKTVEMRLLQAGIRLGALLNRLLR